MRSAESLSFHAIRFGIWGLAHIFKKKKPKCFQKDPLIRGGGAGNSGHGSASRPNPALGDTPEESRPRRRGARAASQGGQDPAAGCTSGGDGSQGAPQPTRSPMSQLLHPRRGCLLAAAKFQGLAARGGWWPDAECWAPLELPQPRASLVPCLLAQHPQAPLPQIQPQAGDPDPHVRALPAGIIRL